jgi:hypothetical protein
LVVVQAFLPFLGKCFRPNIQCRRLESVKTETEKAGSRTRFQAGAPILCALRGAWVQSGFACSQPPFEMARPDNARPQGNSLHALDQWFSTRRATAEERSAQPARQDLLLGSECLAKRMEDHPARRGSHARRRVSAQVKVDIVRSDDGL